jgi:hypothetical protein
VEAGPERESGLDHGPGTVNSQMLSFEVAGCLPISWPTIDGGAGSYADIGLQPYDQSSGVSTGMYAYPPFPPIWYMISMRKRD